MKTKRKMTRTVTKVQNKPNKVRSPELNYVEEDKVEESFGPSSISLPTNTEGASKTLNSDSEAEVNL